MSMMKNLVLPILLIAATNSYAEGFQILCEGVLFLEKISDDPIMISWDGTFLAQHHGNSIFDKSGIKRKMDGYAKLPSSSMDNFNAKGIMYSFSINHGLRKELKAVGYFADPQSAGKHIVEIHHAYLDEEGFLVRTMNLTYGNCAML